MLPRLPLFLAGPTASGKSAVAFQLAERLRGEIISVDSMQVYRGMDIGTAKPSRTDQARVRHHLVDVVDLTERFHAAQFVTLAQAAVQEIASRGRVAIFCGGTGLYFSAYLEGLGGAPGANAVIRAELEALSTPELLSELAVLDPATFSQIDRQNRRRVVRALEVIRITGKPFSAQRASWAPSGTARGAEGLFLCLDRSAEDLAVRIEDRVERMFAKGLVAETASLLPKGLAQNATALQALGYRQVFEHLQGMRGLSETVALVKQKTRQFAKRQRTWFRNKSSAQWLRVSPKQEPEEIAGQIEQLYAGFTPRV